MRSESVSSRNCDMIFGRPKIRERGRKMDCLGMVYTQSCGFAIMILVAVLLLMRQRLQHEVQTG